MGQTVENEHGEFTPIWWYVAFIPRNVKNWWDILSPPWARHVLCWGYSTHTNAWVVVNPKDRVTGVSIVPDDLFDDVLDDILAHDPTILQFRMGPGSVYSNRTIQTCAAVVARVVGLPGGAWRPASLFTKLMANKATVKRLSNEHKSQSAERRSGNQGTPGGR